LSLKLSVAVLTPSEPSLTNTIAVLLSGSRGFIAAVTRTAGPRPFGRAGPACEWTSGWAGVTRSYNLCAGVSNGPGDSYPAAERYTNVLCEADRYRSRELRQM
jgi:hypothetical protein